MEEPASSIAQLEERRRSARTALVAALAIHFSALAVAILAGIISSRLTEQIAELRQPVDGDKSGQ